MSINKANSNTSWYKEPWMWLVVMLPVSSVIAGISTVFIAASTSDSLVVDNYYQTGLTINDNKQANEAAKKLGIHGQLIFTDENIQLQIAMNDINEQQKLPEQLYLLLSHPTHQHKDLEVRLNKTSQNLYSASEKTSISGRYYMNLHPKNDAWLIQQQLVIDADKVIGYQAQ